MIQDYANIAFKNICDFVTVHGKGYTLSDRSS